jgi:hypothetical protein
MAGLALLGLCFGVEELLQGLGDVLAVVLRRARRRAGRAQNRAVAVVLAQTPWLV